MQSSRRYHRFAMLFSLLICIALFAVSAYGLFVSSASLQLESKFSFFKVVFAIIGLLWSVLLFVAEFSGWRWFTINFGCLKNRVGKAVNYALVGLLAIVFGTFSTGTQPMLGVGIGAFEAVCALIVHMESVIVFALTNVECPHFRTLNTVLVLIGVMHAATYCPCMVNEVEESDLALTFEETQRMREAQVLANA